MSQTSKLETLMIDIKSPHSQDVLCGRGGAIYKHIGNYTFRYLVLLNKNVYFSSKKSDKIKVARSLVNAIRDQTPTGRFLKQNLQSGLWSDIGDKRAIEKTSQALREGQGSINQNPSGRNSEEHSESLSTGVDIPTGHTTSNNDDSDQDSTEAVSTHCENEYMNERVDQTLSFVEVASSEKMDTSTSSEDLPRMQKAADDEELNHLICQTFSMDEGYWLKHIPQLPSMNQISTWSATSSKEGCNLNQTNKEKMTSYLTEGGEHENLEKINSNYHVRNNNYDAKHKRVEYSNILGHNPNFSAKDIISDQADESNSCFPIKAAIGNSVHHKIQRVNDGTTLGHTKRKNPIWYAGRSA